ncbi:MAG: hypothetical protein HeimC3_42310 [Candidatus Heimdallarchaeota archaeon LC_3]|nr:MAG: hypothetical protein HeimC3_42310 [Candidatus Heimdallarchaeota archaeon LC_3]
MSENNFSLLTWFREKRTEKIKNQFIELTIKVTDTCYEYLNAMISLTTENDSDQDKKDQALSALNRVIIQERSADHIKQELFREISRVRIEGKYREDLFKLIYQIDPIANWIKVAGKNAILLLELNLDLPDDIWARFKTITEMIVSSSRLLRKMIEKLGVDDESLLNIRTEIETLESSVDDLYFLVKKVIFSRNFSVQTSLLAIDLLEGLENSSDHCAGAADILYILVMASR